jgi:hypothetical protein
MTFALGLLAGAFVALFAASIFRDRVQEQLDTALATLVLLRCHARDRGDFRDVRLITRVLDPDDQEAGA